MLSDTLLASYGEATQAILVYGSCLRSGDDRDGLVDLYLLVDSYYSAYGKRFPATLNKLLPPNVFYLEVPYKDRVVRAKYAILSLTDFTNGASRRWFHSYIWGRFAQPVGLLYARSDRVARNIQSALTNAVLTFISRIIPRMTTTFTARDLWAQGLALSYQAELRAERPDKLIHLFDAAPDYYEHLTRSALDHISVPVAIQQDDRSNCYTMSISNRTRWMGRLDWMVRSWQGKLLSVLRLLKGLLTFRGGVDYILWKIERHSGEKIEVPPQLQRYPLLATCLVLWKLYRRGAYR